MDMLTKLEELILLSVWGLKENAYGSTIYNSYMGEATKERRGLSKRYYTLSGKGFEALNDTKRINDIMWAGYPVLAFMNTKNR